MILPGAPDFDLKKIAESGQCFRMSPREDGCELRALGRHVCIRQAGEGYLLDCPAEDEPLWRNYFDLDADYGAYKADPSDEYLARAAACGRGLRILRQDPFETLITFILSQRMNIPAIKSKVERLCRDYGEDMCFPEASRLALCAEQELRDCALGYRAPYVLAAARMTASGDLDLTACGALSDAELESELRRVPGVGPKVARCVMLFAYHRLDAFPVDVWIHRALREAYPTGFPYGRYAGYSGVMQQYLFYYARSRKEALPFP